jgi:hypothetical protein
MARVFMRGQGEGGKGKKKKGEPFEDLEKARVLGSSCPSIWRGARGKETIRGSI